MELNIDIELTSEQLMKAISQGVYLAIWHIANNATHAPCADFYESIKQGVKEETMETNHGD